MLKDPGIAPNFNSVISEEDRQIMLEGYTSADGNIYSMTQYEPQAWNMTPYRMYINQTWLDKLNLDMPTTTILMAMDRQMRLLFTVSLQVHTVRILPCR